MSNDRSVPQQFEVIAGRYPARTAIRCNGRELDYRTLSEQAAHLAQRLRSHGVRAGDRVALYLPRSIDAVVAMLAIMKAGAAYVPFDVAYPPLLLEFIAQDSAPTLILSNTTQLGARGALSFGPAPVLNLDTELVQPEATGIPHEPWLTVGPDECAYIMYTSG